MADIRSFSEDAAMSEAEKKVRAAFQAGVGGMGLNLRGSYPGGLPPLDNPFFKNPPISPTIVGPDLDLTDEEVTELQKAWEIANDGGTHKRAPAFAIFHHIFSQMDEIRNQVFNVSDITQDEMFHKHVKNFNDYIDNMIAHLDDREEFDQLAEQLGRRHVYVRTMEFRPNYWDTFSSSIISCALDEPKLRVQANWRKVILYMIAKMKAAYYKECRLSKRKMSSNLARHFSTST